MLPELNFALRGGGLGDRIASFKSIMLTMNLMPHKGRERPTYSSQHHFVYLDIFPNLVLKCLALGGRLYLAARGTHPNQGDVSEVIQEAGVCLTRTLAWRCCLSLHHAGK